MLTHEFKLGQSVVAELQPHFWLTHAWPLLFDAHDAHTPELPHAPGAVPGWQVPPVIAEQQPPLHACVELHAVVQVFVVVSHDVPDGQSAVAAQPQAPLKH